MTDVDRSFVIFGSGRLPWIYPIGVALARYGPTTVIQIRGALPGLGGGKALWPFPEQPPGLDREVWTYPPGFASKLKWLFSGPIRHRLKLVSGRMQAASGSPPTVLVSNPRLAEYAVDVDPRRLIYRSYDDYSDYSANGSRLENPWEPAVIQRSGLIACCSRFQASVLAERFPDRAHAVSHVPHGVHNSFINPRYTEPERPSVLIGGSLTARYDWKYIRAVVERLPEVRFTFVGRINRGRVGSRVDNWSKVMDEVLSRENVQHLDGVEYRETASEYWAASMNWMPYDVDMHFVQASCPLKLTDGLASGRPILSTDVPEARLYPEWIRICDGVDDTVSAMLEVLHRDPAIARDRFRAQLEFAKENTWSERARKLVSLMD